MLNESAGPVTRDRWKAFVPAIVLAIMAVAFGGFELLGGAMPMIGGGFAAAAAVYAIKGWFGQRCVAKAEADGVAAPAAMAKKLARAGFSWVGWIALALLVLAAWAIADGVFRDKAIQHALYSAYAYATPIAIEARRVFEESGRWPEELKGLPDHAGAPPPQVQRVNLEKDGSVRVVMADATGVGGGALVLSVRVREGERFLTCRAEGIPPGPLPSRCRPDGDAERVAWPPAKRSMTPPGGRRARDARPLPPICRLEANEPAHGPTGS